MYQYNSIKLGVKEYHKSERVQVHFTKMGLVEKCNNTIPSISSERASWRMKDVIIQFQNYFKCTKMEGYISKMGIDNKNCIHTVLKMGAGRMVVAGESAKEYHKSKSVQ